MQDITGTGGGANGLQIGLKVIQEVVKDQLQGNIVKLKENLTEASETMKDNLQAGLQSAFQTGADAMEASRDQSSQEHHNKNEIVKPATDKHELAKTSSKDSQSYVDRSRELFTRLIADGNNLEDLVDKLVGNIGTAKNTLDKISTGIDIARDALEQAGPLIGQQENMKKLQEILNALAPRVRMAKEIIDKIELLLNSQGDDSTIRSILDKFTGGLIMYRMSCLRSKKELIRYREH
ncbi:hypothetical protein KDW_06220 [Dictyobacter vulcani]|uniref:Uncharacterized protein n=1 Tax=Dictyobacter vulcani TaxID=2607529 RepID=A0A5J4KJE9_9CHLR|nr:hypothetical protein [Dictyobacter vulcani]GER86460.1 hypothetical protein KDW_06220 [Dictyobacter vulcani]